MKRWPIWIVTFGGSGLLKPAPGTWGSLAAIIVLAVVHHFCDTPGNTSGNWPLFLVGFLITASVLNVALGRWIVRNMGEDPGPCVIDEAAGIALTLIGLPMHHPLATFPVALLMFRIFDITKLPPARQLEDLPAGWGILMDDLAAAVYANIVAHIFLSVV